MVRVTVRTLGRLASIIGGSQVQVDASMATVGGLLDEMVSRFGAPVGSYLYPDGENLSDMLFILIDGRNISHLNGLGTPKGRRYGLHTSDDRRRIKVPRIYQRR